jgi:hypothetical protein
MAAQGKSVKLYEPFSNEILKRLMDEVDYEAFMERQYKKLEEKKKFVSLDEI